MRICSNCKTNKAVSSRKLGTDVQSLDQRENSYSKSIDMCNQCWDWLNAEDFQGLHDAFVAWRDMGT